MELMIIIFSDFARVSRVLLRSLELVKPKHFSKVQRKVRGAITK